MECPETRARHFTEQLSLQIARGQKRPAGDQASASAPKAAKDEPPAYPNKKSKADHPGEISPSLIKCRAVGRIWKPG